MEKDQFWPITRLEGVQSGDFEQRQVAESLDVYIPIGLQRVGVIEIYFLPFSNQIVSFACCSIGFLGDLSFTDFFIKGSGVRVLGGSGGGVERKYLFI